MKVYIAAPYPMKLEAEVIWHSLERLGHDVVSGWLWRKDDNSDLTARLDLAEIDLCDALVALNLGGWEERGTGGRHVELGYALGKNKRVFLIGERTNLFHWHSNVVQISALSQIDAFAREARHA